MSHQTNTHLDELDALVPDVAKKTREVGYLSTGEKMYVYLAANRIDLLEKEGFTIVEALHRLGSEWLIELLQRWQYRGDPKQTG